MTDLQAILIFFTPLSILILITVLYSLYDTYILKNNMYADDDITHSEKKTVYKFEIQFETLEYNVKFEDKSSSTFQKHIITIRAKSFEKACCKITKQNIKHHDRLAFNFRPLSYKKLKKQ